VKDWWHYDLRAGDGQFVDRSNVMENNGTCKIDAEQPEIENKS
jgi:hypothetical protein